MNSYETEMALIKREQEQKEELRKMDEALQVSNIFVNKGYLNMFSSAEILPGNRALLENTQKIRLFRMTKVVFDPEEDVLDKLVSVYSALYNMNANTAVILKGKPDTLEFYFACRSDDAAPLAGAILESTLVGNFPGIDLHEYKANELPELLQSINIDKDNHKMLNGLASVSMVPSIRDKEKKDQFIQGMEKLIQTMKGKEFLGVLLAAPCDSTGIENRRHGLEELYSAMSPFARFSYAYGENVSHSVGKGLSSSFSKSVNESISNSNSTSTSSTHGTSRGYTDGSNIGGSYSSDGSSSSWGVNSGSSSSTSESYTSGTSFSHSVSNSVGTSETDGININENDTIGSSLNKTVNFENKGISEMLQRIDQQLQRINQQEAYGLWEMAAYFFSNDTSSAALAAAAYKAIMAGETSGIEQAHVNVWTNSVLQEENIKNIYNHVVHLVHPRAVIVLEKGYNQQLVTPTTMVSSMELGQLLGFPRKSVAGVAVQEMAEFGRDVVYENKLPKRSISFGHIYHMGLVENTRVEMDADLFSSHCFITGSSGSGKSYATYNLLDKLLEKDVRMLVVEPAKGEYKQIFGKLNRVNIFTTDSNAYQLLRVNPFQFPEKVHVLSHIEQLMQIFTAAWPLYAAMPAILKQAVVNAYIRCGWDLQNSIWIKGISDRKYPVFQDVLATLPDIINTSDYSAESKGDYKGALLTRVEAMTTGINGLIFARDEGISDEKMFDENTLIDLSEVGSQETIALLMGVIVMRLGEYRKSQRKLGITSSHDSKLKHITVMEEAHNILKRTNKEQGEDGGNMVGQSVEMISNSIKEMRTYGEGFLIIDQSPLAVDTSAIENTATKIIMNTPSKDACDELGSALSLTEEQTKELSRLNVGVAAVLQKGWMTPVLMKVDLWNASKYEAPLQYEDLSKERYVRSCLMLELIRQVKEKKYEVNPFGKIIRGSALSKERKEEMMGFINVFNAFLEKERNFTPQMIGNLFFEVTSCRSMIKVIPTKGILNAEEFIKKLDEIASDKVAAIYDDQIRLEKSWIEKTVTALDQYVNVEREDKQIAVRYMLLEMGDNGKDESTPYGLMAFLLKEGYLEREAK
ncbi:MAG: ATP-binding protein [Lachnospiraceae bacterium]|nr:ATP-binding protein [Lachnospiraceae bacterium]